MTTLNMDVNIAETAVGKMQDAVQQWLFYQDKNRGLMRESLYVTNNWLGASAKNFFDTYNKTDSKVNAQLQEYAKLTEALYNELIEWATRSSHLSSDATDGKVILGPSSFDPSPSTKPAGQVTIDGDTLSVPSNNKPAGQVTIDGTKIEMP